jgi:hypothetical protein
MNLQHIHDLRIEEGVQMRQDKDYALQQIQAVS